MKCPNCNAELKLVANNKEIHTSKIELQHAEIKKSIDEDFKPTKEEVMERELIMDKETEGEDRRMF